MSENTIQEIVSKPSIETVLKFITKYREMEKASLEMGYGHIQKMLASKFDYGTIQHLCGHWRYKKKDFSDWYLNLSTHSQVLVLHAFGIIDSQDEKYIEELKKNAMVALWVDAPNTAFSLKSLLKFFYNNSIQPSTFKHFDLPIIGIKFPTTHKKCYGNSANWGNFILENSIIDSTPLHPLLNFAMNYR